jgi:hypothetical protein
LLALVGGAATQAEKKLSTHLQPFRSSWIVADFVEPPLHDRLPVDEVLKNANYANLSDPPLARIRALGGVGLREDNDKEGIRNVILMKFRVRPPGIENIDSVVFDIGRQKESIFRRFL